MSLLVGRPRQDAEAWPVCGGCLRAVPPAYIEGLDEPDFLDEPGAPRIRLLFCGACARALDLRRDAWVAA